jgi:hypothetical protein
MVNTRSDAENETGNAKLLNVFFSDGYKEIWSRVRIMSQLITEKICCSMVRTISPSPF